MKKPSSKIRAEMARLQEQLKIAETREAEKLGRIALKAGLGDVEIDETALLAAFTEISARFRTDGEASSGKGEQAESGETLASKTHPIGAATGNDQEA